MVLAALQAPASAAPAETSRIVYVSAVTAAGQPVTDLTAADLAVRENGQAREVGSLVPATEPYHMAVIVDDGGEGLMQAPVADLLVAVGGHGEVSLSMLNPQAIRLNDYTTDHATLQQSLSRLVERGRLAWDPNVLPDAISFAARDLRKRQLARPVIVVLTNRGESADREVVRSILEDVRDSGASLHVVHVVGLQLDDVLVDGPVRSGGSSAVVSSTGALSDALVAITRTLDHQYKLTYILPDGVKPNERVQISSTRPDVTVVAPTRLAPR